MKYILFILLYFYLSIGGCYGVKVVCSDPPEYKYKIINVLFIVVFIPIEVFFWLPMLIADFIINNIE